MCWINFARNAVGAYVNSIQANPRSFLFEHLLGRGWEGNRYKIYSSYSRPKCTLRVRNLSHESGVPQRKASMKIRNPHNIFTPNSRRLQTHNEDCQQPTMPSSSTKWDPYSVLNIDKSGTVCHGRALSRGRRCRAPVAQANRQEAECMLSRLFETNPISTSLDDWLPTLANLVLCEIHRGQSTTMVAGWRGKLVRESKDNNKRGEGGNGGLNKVEDIARLRKMKGKSSRPSELFKGDSFTSVLGDQIDEPQSCAGRPSPWERRSAHSREAASYRYKGNDTFSSGPSSLIGRNSRIESSNIRSRRTDEEHSEAAVPSAITSSAPDNGVPHVRSRTIIEHGNGAIASPTFTSLAFHNGLPNPRSRRTVEYRNEATVPSMFIPPTFTRSAFHNGTPDMRSDRTVQERSDAAVPSSSVRSAYHSHSFNVRIRSTFDHPTAQSPYFTRPAFSEASDAPPRRTADRQSEVVDPPAHVRPAFHNIEGFDMRFTGTSRRPEEARGAAVPQPFVPNGQARQHDTRNERTPASRNPASTLSMNSPLVMYPTPRDSMSSFNNTLTRNWQGRMVSTPPPRRPRLNASWTAQTPVQNASAETPATLASTRAQHLPKGIPKSLAELYPASVYDPRLTPATQSLGIPAGADMAPSGRPYDPLLHGQYAQQGYTDPGMAAFYHQYNIRQNFELRRGE